MNNKVLIKVYILKLDKTYDIFIPINEVVWKIKKLIMKSISDLNDIPEIYNTSFILVNKRTLKIYDNNEVIYKTDIRNATELMFI